MTDQPRIAGLLLAAGGGRRMGQPKALVRGDSGEPWVVRGARVLLDSGCSPVVVVLGAGGAEAAQLLVQEFGDEARLLVVHAELWREGMSASLRAGIEALSRGGAGVRGSELDRVPLDGVPLDGTIVTLVDTPSLRVETVGRIRSAATARSSPRSALVQAMYGERPGHPVFLGSTHWPGLLAMLTGDSGAKDYMSVHETLRIDCRDLEPGDDVDSVNNTQL